MANRGGRRQSGKRPSGPGAQQSGPTAQSGKDDPIGKCVQSGKWLEVQVMHTARKAPAFLTVGHEMCLNPPAVPHRSPRLRLSPPPFPRARSSIQKFLENICIFLPSGHWDTAGHTMRIIWATFGHIWPLQAFFEIIWSPYGSRPDPSRSCQLRNQFETFEAHCVHTDSDFQNQKTQTMCVYTYIQL